MKFIAFLVFVAAVSALATIVQITPDDKCEDSLIAPTYSDCGANIVSPTIYKRGIRIIQNEHGVIFYKNWRCTGDATFEVKGPVSEEEQCYDLKKFGVDPNKPACIYIVCPA